MSERRARILKVARPVAIVLAVLYVAVCGVIFAVMHQRPSVVARFMDKVPGPAWAVLPMPAMWKWVNRGDLQPGDPAPDFELATVDGKSRVRLSSLRGTPVVLYFGSYTCPPFRKRMPDMNALYEAHKHHAQFYFVYVEEAHSTDGWPADDNTKDKVLYTSHQRLEDRIKVGGVCQEAMKIAFPMLVDEMDNRVETAYRAWPVRVYVIDKEGKVAFKGLPGPFGFKADLIRPELERVLGPPGA
jgi:cytochrome oxidase Cu insertion factor (SCO1/SenC/PrrC family)